MAELKLQYSATQEYQIKAVDAVVDLFVGQEFRAQSFTAEAFQGSNEPAVLGYSNKVYVTHETLLENLHRIQDDNCLPNTNALTEGRLRDFTVEMETGTGKTYVYTRTILELHKRYGLTKFIVVVPSVAIREGVKKSLESTSEHFRQLYDGVTIDPFIYDSGKPERINGFATSSELQVMIINIDAFRKKNEEDDNVWKTNLFHRPSEKLVGGRSPRELIEECNPIIIIDEPQSVDSTVKSKAAIRTLNPLFVLRYSATHKEPYNKIYSLTPVDAFQENLVKGIVVDSITADENLNTAFVQLESVKASSGIKANLLIDQQDARGFIKRKKVAVKTADNLHDKSNENSRYSGGDWILSNIGSATGREFVEFSNGTRLMLGESVGDVSDAEIKRAQIARAIQNHLETQLVLYSKGVKVLTLFFIDKVARYRDYANPTLMGEYAEIFEEAYSCLAARIAPRYEAKGVPLIGDPKLVHDGYFSEDGKGMFKDTNGTTAADLSSYELIMKSKETLISFPSEDDVDSAKRDKQKSFIFSHSALKEGWDNPNVFQICSLTEIRNDLTKRQKIGRGLRICVNQSGERVMDSDVNQLTVIATEAVEDFAKGLQSEFAQEGIRFGVLVAESFSNIVIVVEDEKERLGAERSRVVYAYLQGLDLIGEKGYITEELKSMAENDELELPKDLMLFKQAVQDRIIYYAANLPIRDKATEVIIEANEDAFQLPEFTELWNRIKIRTTYRLEVNSDSLVDKAIESIDKMPVVAPLRIRGRSATVAVEESGLQTQVTNESIIDVEVAYDYPDPIRELQDRVGLTRKSIKRILEGIEDKHYPGKFRDVAGDATGFRAEPRTFLDQVATRINAVKNELLADGVKYQKLPESEWYAQSVLRPDELKGYLGQNAFKLLHGGDKYLYNYVVYDSSTVEKPYAEKLGTATEVKVFAKLPERFKIDTPLGDYNPDWAYVSERDGHKTLYLVVETKGGKNGMPRLTPTEETKIEYAKKHFEAIGFEDLDYRVETVYRGV